MPALVPSDHCLSSNSPILLITQITTQSTFMDPPLTCSDLLTNPDRDHPPQIFIPDDKIKPVILIFDDTIKLNPCLISKSADHPQLVGTLSCCKLSSAAAAADNEDSAECEKAVISSSTYQSGSAESELWPKLTELDDRPLSPTYNQDAIKQVIRESTYLFPEVNDRPASPNSDGRKPCKKQAIKETTYQPAEQEDDRQSSRGNPTVIIKPDEMQMIREAAYLSLSEAKRDEYDAGARSTDDRDQKAGKPTMQAIRAAVYQSPLHDKLSGMKEGLYMRNSERGRLSRVVEESESFSRREFGANVLHYMSTHSSASHASNFSNFSSYTHTDFSSSHTSYHHNYYSTFSYTHAAAADNFMTSKSAPAGTATRTGSGFAFFRRGSSEGAHLAAARRAVYRRQRSRKPRSLGSRLLWPLLKIKNGYVGCMMGLEGSGDLSGMAQGSTYATTGRYFADVPLSKADSRNYG